MYREHAHDEASRSFSVSDKWKAVFDRTRTRWDQRAAEMGDAEAQFKYACFLEHSEQIFNTDDVPMHHPKSAGEWYLRAAKQNHSAAQYHLAIWLGNRGSTIEDAKQVMHWFQTAAVNGHDGALERLPLARAVLLSLKAGPSPDMIACLHSAAGHSYSPAAFALAECCRKGHGTEKDDEKAFTWYHKAAEAEHLEGIFCVAESFRRGAGTTKNFKKAFRLYRKLSEIGHVQAQLALSDCFQNGLAQLVTLRKRRCGISEPPSLATRTRSTIMRSALSLVWVWRRTSFPLPIGFERRKMVAILSQSYICFNWGWTLLLEVWPFKSSLLCLSCILARCWPLRPSRRPCDACVSIRVIRGCGQSAERSEYHVNMASRVDDAVVDQKSIPT